ncbi:MAG: cob(I)yrinic acid a,c-diamide adenosyltransferase [Bacteroidota bacterium]
MKIYTKTGDDGTTGLFGGTRLPKFALRIEAYGTVDELNAVLGIALTHEMPERLATVLKEISSLLFTVGADLATPLHPAPKYHIPRVEPQHIEMLEALIDEYTDELPALKNFILPGGTQAAAHLHLARTVCRRAERIAVHLASEEDIGETVIKFLNRLSDYLFTAARLTNKLAGVEDVAWEPSKR